MVTFFTLPSCAVNDLLDLGRLNSPLITSSLPVSLQYVVFTFRAIISLFGSPHVSTSRLYSDPITSLSDHHMQLVDLHNNPTICSLLLNEMLRTAVRAVKPFRAYVVASRYFSKVTSFWPTLFV